MRPEEIHLAHAIYCAAFATTRSGGSLNLSFNSDPSQLQPVAVALGVNDGKYSGGELATRVEFKQKLERLLAG